MKKHLSFVIFICVLIVCLCGCKTRDDRDYAYYCYQINSAVQNFDFYKGEISDNHIYLYDKSGEILQNIDFDKYDKNFPILYFRKDSNNNIFYIINAAVDDEEGIMFINNEANSVLNGVASVRRLGGNSYYYSTVMNN